TPKHHSLIHPLAYARNVIDERNRRQRSGYPHADLVKMEVYRGQPVEEHEPKRYAYTQQELSRWTRDDRIDVIYRPLKYTIDRNSGVIRGIQEKGVDVLCALAVIRAVMNSNIDLVILATHDSDLDPCLEEAVQIGGTGTRVETTGWASSQIRTRQAPNVHGRKLWRTFLDEEAYRRCLDPDR
ncbi:NYN domain-containing protein, partial [Rhodococcus sp. DMU2021]